MMLAYLAEHYNGEFIPLKEISERQDISKKYLEQIVPMFAGSDLLRAERGAQGGYMLGRSPDKISVGDILRITEGSLAPVDPDSCDIHSPELAVMPVWNDLADTISDFLDGITLQDIADRQRESYANDYFI